MAIKSLFWVHQQLRNGKLDQYELTPLARFALTVLSGYADEKRQAWPTLEELARVMGVTSKTVSKLVAELESAEIIGRVFGKHPKNTRYTNIYTVKIIPDEIKEDVQQDDTDPQQPLLGTDRDALINNMKLPSWLPRSVLRNLPEWISPQTWLDFEKSRKELKKPLTNGARTRLIAHLRNLKEAHEPFGTQYANAVIEQSITRTWLGLFDLTGYELEQFNKTAFIPKIHEYRDLEHGYRIIHHVHEHPDGRVTTKTAPVWEKLPTEVWERLLFEKEHDSLINVKGLTIEEAKARIKERVKELEAARESLSDYELAVLQHDHARMTVSDPKLIPPMPERPRPTRKPQKMQEDKNLAADFDFLFSDPETLSLSGLGD